MSITGYNPATVSTLTTGTYRHVALSISGTWHTLYLDGSMVAQNLSGGNIFTAYSSLSNLYIGCAGDLSYGYTGFIDDFKIWNRALPPADVSAVYWKEKTTIPSSIPGMILWLDAADTTSFVLSGSNVSTWRDKSALGNNAVANAASSNITLSTFPSTSYKTVAFANTAGQNTNYLLMSNLKPNNFPFTYFAVYSFPNNGNASIYTTLFSKYPVNGDGSKVLQLGPSNTSTTTNVNMYLSVTGGGETEITINYTNPGGLNLITVQMNSSPSTSCVVNVNGSSVVTSFNGTYPSGASTLTNIAINGANGMYLSEAIWYQGASAALSQAQYQRIEGYLAWKWGINSRLPTTHPYYSAAPQTIPPVPAIDNLSSTVKSAMLGTGKSAGAYGVRLLNSAYTGPIMNIRNATTTTTADFYADVYGNLGTGANGTGTSLATWLNGAVAQIVTWYDQTGNARHATGSTGNYPTLSNATITTIASNTIPPTGYYVSFNTTGSTFSYFSLPDNTLPYGNTNYSYVTKTYIVQNAFNPNGVSLIGGGVWGASSNYTGITYNHNGTYANFSWNSDDSFTTGANANHINEVATMTYNSTNKRRYGYITYNNTTTSSTGANLSTFTRIQSNTNNYMGLLSNNGSLFTSANNAYAVSKIYYMYVLPIDLQSYPYDRAILEAT